MKLSSETELIVVLLTGFAAVGFIVSMFMLLLIMFGVVARTFSQQYFQEILNKYIFLAVLTGAITTVGTFILFSSRRT